MRDVIVVGARVAGSATAMLLARQGLDVLAVDRASFPSDTLSTHQVHVAGGACLARWGLYERLLAAGTPPARGVRFDTGAGVVAGPFPVLDGVGALISPRRTLLDAMLVEAARDAGAEMRENVVVDELTSYDGRVTGVRARERGGRSWTESARLVVGADGRHSLVARAVGAESYRETPARTVCYYSYWQGLPSEGELYGRGRRSIGVWPTNDDLTIVVVFAPREELPAFRADIEGMFLSSLDLAGQLGSRVRAATRVERFYGTADSGGFFRRPHGAGWALVGDAGLALDPITGQGISHAFRDAGLLSEAIRKCLVDGAAPEPALAAYAATRDELTGPMYDFTAEIAALAPPGEAEEVLFGALARKPAETERFLGMIAGVVPVDEFMSPLHLLRVVGLRGMTRLIRSRRAPKPARPPQQPPVPA